jgi:hypothetical protein
MQVFYFVVRHILGGSSCLEWKKLSNGKMLQAVKLRFQIVPGTQAVASKKSAGPVVYVEDLEG